MNDLYWIFFIYLFLGYSFGLFMMGYLAGQDDEWRKSRNRASRKKEIQREEKEWLEEIKRN